MGYREDYVQYRRESEPGYEIPKGYHVHHKVPRSLGGTDDPRNLIALHPEDHVTIHELRGDRVSSSGFHVMAEAIYRKHPMLGRKQSEETKEKISSAHMGKPKHTKESRKKISEIKKVQCKGKSNPRAREWVLEHRDGTTIVLDCLTEFCKKHGWSDNSLRDTLRFGNFHKKSGYRVLSRT